jgi:hypothetical protein
MPDLRSLALAAVLFLAATPGAALSPRDRPPVTRPMADHDMAREERSNGDLRSLGQLLACAQRPVGRAEYLGVEPDIGASSYRFKFMRPDGRVMWVDVDARSCRVLSMR